MSLIQLIYVSRNRGHGGSKADLALLRSILSVSRRNNVRDELTGFLLFDHVWFVQILEGERETATRTFHRISADGRHGDVTLMALRDVRRRSFPRWSMGGALRSLDQQEIYLRHGIAGDLVPAKLTAPGIVALAMDLQDHDALRQQAVAAA